MTISNEIFNEILKALDSKDDKKVKELFVDIHPYDFAQFLITIDDEHRKKLVKYFSDEELAEIIQELDYEQQKEFINEVGIKKASQILVEMSSDDAADLLGELDEQHKQKLFSLIDEREAADIKELLEYPENSAGGLMTTEYVIIPKYYTAEETLAKLRGTAPDAETVYYLYVVDEEEKLIGVLSLRDLIVASTDTKIAHIMSERVVSVPVDMDQEAVARIMEKYDFLAIPVVDHNKRLVGIITFDDAMDVLKDETTEDISRFGGIGGKDSEFQDLKVGSFEAAKTRIPWLVLLLFIGIMSGNIIAQFEETLEAVVVLAIFIPMIAGMAGNTGTQALAVVVRGLAMGEFTSSDALRLVKREAGVGIIIGIANGVIISILVAVWQSNLYLGFVIGLSLLVTLFFATIAGTIIPLIMVKLKIDPAVASGPFITTINDIIGLTIYFTIATMFMSYLI